MSDQEILDMLADVECELFHKWSDMGSNHPDYVEMGAAHQAARKALETFWETINHKKIKDIKPVWND